MKREKGTFNVFDLLFILFFAGLAAVLIIFTAPRGKTVKISYTLSVSEGDTGALKENDELVSLSGGCLGKVVSSGDGYIEVETDAEYRAGVYYSGAAALKDGRRYEFCSGTNRFTASLHRITES